jgi:hypothetical protein
MFDSRLADDLLVKLELELKMVFAFQMMLRVLLLGFCTFHGAFGIENPIPASLLQPRDFNPHPYQRQGKFLIAPADEYQSVQAERRYGELTRRFQKLVAGFYQEVRMKLMFEFQHCADKIP